MFYNKWLKMTERSSVECNSYENHNAYPNLNAIPLSDQQQFTLKKINEIKDYVVAEIKERELMSKRLISLISNISLLLTILTNH